MAISAQELTEAIQDIKHIQANLSDEYRESVAKSIRDSQINRKSIYEKSWNTKVASIDSMVASGKDFGAIVRELIKPVPRSGLLSPAINRNVLNIDLGDFEYTPGQKLCAFDGRYRQIDENYMDFRLIDCLKDCLAPDVDCVVEFGAGWGKNLSLLLIGSGRSDVEFIACEPSSSGRYCFEKLFSQLAGVKFSSQPFDFSDPKMDMIGERKHVLAFTSAAIEQVVFLPRSFMKGLLNLAEKVTLVFYEPIGWQRSMDHFNRVFSTVLDEYGGKSVPGAYKNGYVFKFSDEYFLDNSSSWAILSKYNINLLNILNNVVNEEKAALLGVHYDIYSSNPLNPYSLFILEKK